MAGFYVTIIGRGIIKIADYKDNNLMFCFLFLLVAFATIITSLFRTVSYNILEKEEKKDYIKFREDNNLPQFNVKLFSALREQTVSYINSFVSIAFSLFSLIGYCLNYDYFYLFSLIIMILTLMLFLFPSFCLKLIDFSAKYRTRKHFSASLMKNPSKKEIEKRQKLIPIYLTVTSVPIALIKIDANYSQNLASNSTTVSDVQIGFFEQLLELIDTKILNFNFLIVLYFLFFVFIIGYYIILDSPSRKLPTILGLSTSVCFGSIFTINLRLLANYTNLEWWHLILLFSAFLLISFIVAISLIWTSNKDNPKANVEDK